MPRFPGHASDRGFDRICCEAALRSAGIHRHRNGEIEIFTEPIEAGMHFCHARAAFEDQASAAVTGEVVQQNRAEIILLDDLGRKACLGSRVGNRLTKQRDIFMAPEVGIVIISH